MASYDPSRGIYYLGRQVRESLVDVRIYITPLEEEGLLVPTSGQLSIDRGDPGSSEQSPSSESQKHHCIVSLHYLPKSKRWDGIDPIESWKC
jgi:hypothetical protein